MPFALSGFARRLAFDWFEGRAGGLWNSSSLK